MYKIAAILALALSANQAEGVLLEKHHHHKHHHHQLAQPDCNMPHTKSNMDEEMDNFSRTFDITHYNNAVNIFNTLKSEGYKGKLPHVKTWELYNDAFSFKKIKEHEQVVTNLDTLEHFQDNLNSNISNLHNVRKFIEYGK